MAGKPDPDTVRLLTIASIVLMVAAAAIFMVARKEASRLFPLEVRVVTATPSDPVFRTGKRVLQPGEKCTWAAAVKLGPKKGPKASESFWWCPVEKLVIDGVAVEHRTDTAFPEKDRDYRVIWFSYEPRVLGGRVTEENAAEKLAYDIFPAPEMGFKLVAESEPLFHSDDFLVDEAQVPDAPPSPGAFRVCARFELLRSSSDLIPISGALSSGCTSPLDPKVSVVLRDAELPEPLNPEAGQLFRLGCYQPVGNPKAFGATFSELVEFRVVCSSRWFVKVALGGRDPDPDGLLLETDGEGELYVTMGKRRRLRWGKDVVSGDVVSCDGALWVLLCSDDGDGLLSAGDVVVGCLRGPARWTHLGEVFPEGTCVRLELLHGAKTSS